MEAEIISLEVRNHTVDARNPAPVEVVYPIICRFFYTSQVVSRISSNSIYKHSLFFLSTHCQGRCFRWYSYVVQIEHPKCFFCIHPSSHSTVDGRNPCNPLKMQNASILHWVSCYFNSFAWWLISTSSQSLLVEPNCSGVSHPDEWYLSLHLRKHQCLVCRTAVL